MILLNAIHDSWAGGFRTLAGCGKTIWSRSTRTVMKSPGLTQEDGQQGRPRSVTRETSRVNGFGT